MGIRWSSGKYFSMNMRIDYGSDVEYPDFTANTKFVVIIYDGTDRIVREFDNYNDADDFYETTYERLNKRDDMIDTEGN